MLDILAVCQRIPPYYSVFVTCLKLISNVLSVYQRTCQIFHTSAYVGAIRRSVTGPSRRIWRSKFWSEFAFAFIITLCMRGETIHSSMRICPDSSVLVDAIST